MQWAQHIRYEEIGSVVESFDLLGVKVAVTNLQQACLSIEGWIKEGRKTYVCIAPVATLVDCQKDAQYREIINGSGMTTPDGMPLVWVGKFKGKKTINRTYGPDLMQAMCDFGQDKGHKHFFYGGTQETNNLLSKKLKEQYPHSQIVGSYAPPFRGIKEWEDEGVLEKINQAAPDVLWVGLGSPKQDYWMSQHREKLDVPVMIGVGAAFDFLAGVKKQAPRWVQRSGLEWFFRLCSEPRRLWKRYLIGNTQFVYWVVKDLLLRRQSSGDS